MLQWVWKCRYLIKILISFTLQVRWLDHTVVLFSIFRGHSIPFPIVAPPFYIPTNKAQGSHTFSPRLHQHLISLVFLVTDILRVVRWSPIVVLIHFYLIMSHVSNFSCAFLGIYIFSTFIHILCPFLNRLFCFPLVVWVLHIVLNVHFSSVQSLSHVWLFATPWITALIK